MKRDAHLEFAEDLCAYDRDDVVVQHPQQQVRLIPQGLFGCWVSQRQQPMRCCKELKQAHCQQCAIFVGEPATAVFEVFSVEFQRFAIFATTHLTCFEQKRLCVVACKAH
jgi:hypothetical protein